MFPDQDPAVIAELYDECCTYFLFHFVEGFKDIVIDALMNGGTVNEEMLEAAVGQYKRNKRRQRG